MEAEEIREYCLSKKAVTEGFPFDLETLVFKVGGKMFLLISLEHHPTTFSAKANPEWSEELREEYFQINGAYHMNKIHWNTIEFNSDVSDKMICELINHSYDLVFSKLTKNIKTEIENLEN